MQIRCNFPDISYLSEMQKNNFQFLNNVGGTQVTRHNKLHNATGVSQHFNTSILQWCYILRHCSYMWLGPGAGIIMKMSNNLLTEKMTKYSAILFCKLSCIHLYFYAIITIKCCFTMHFCHVPLDMLYKSPWFLTSP